MHDCPNAEIRDLLPDYAHGALTAFDRARVDGHLATCGACRDELALVEAVLAARVEPGMPDFARIVAALPRPVAPAGRVPAGVVPLDARRRGAVAGLGWRWIAGIAAVVVGAVWIGLLARHGERVGGREPAVVLAPSVQSPADTPPAVPTASAEPRVAVLPDTPSAAALRRPPAHGRVADAGDDLGALGGIASGATADELEALIGGLESLSGIPDVEGAEGEESVRGGGRE